MAEHEHTDREGTSHSEQAPGGSSSRGPEFGTGGEPQVPVPPYDDERGEPGENTATKAYDASHAPAPGPGSEVSAEERSGVTGTETDPEPALGVGTSRGGRAEDLAPDRDDVGTKGPSGRPGGRAPPGAPAEGPEDRGEAESHPYGPDRILT